MAKKKTEPVFKEIPDGRIGINAMAICKAIEQQEKNKKIKTKKAKDEQSFLEFFESWDKLIKGIK